MLLGLSLPHRTGLDILGDLHQATPALKVLVVTMHVDSVMVDASLRLGASGFVPKDAKVEELREAIDEVMRGRRYVSPRLPKQTWGEGPDRLGFSGLTTRQQEIVRMIGRGMTTDDIAAALGISDYTVHFHRKNIRRKLGLESDFAMLRYAILVQLSDAPPDDSWPGRRPDCRSARARFSRRVGRPLVSAGRSSHLRVCRRSVEPAHGTPAPVGSASQE